MTTPALRATYPGIDWETVNVFPMLMPSRRMMLLVLPSPTTQADREWLAKLVDLCVKQEDIDMARAVEDRDATIERLRYALQPFASVADDPEFQGDEEYTPPDDMRIDPLLRLGWFRRARAALEGNA